MELEEMNGRFAALEEQRNNFANQVVILNGICNMNNAKIKALEEELSKLKSEKLDNVTSIK